MNDNSDETTMRMTVTMTARMMMMVVMVMMMMMMAAKAMMIPCDDHVLPFFPPACCCAETFEPRTAATAAGTNAPPGRPPLPADAYENLGTCQQWTPPVLQHPSMP